MLARRRLPAALLALLLAPAAALAQDFENVQIRAVPVAEGVHMLVGAGGNIGVSTGPDGVFLIDDQYAPLTDKIRAAVGGIGGGDIRFVLNTHWHGDHTGGNENLGQAGALIVAHENVRERMSTEQFVEAFNARFPPSPEDALPVVTFTDAVTFHLNDDEIHAFHVPPAHTDGDALVHFRKANVIHMGDTYFNGAYPFVDLSSGGSVAGVIAAADRALELSDDGTRIIPGHGPLASPADLRAYRDVVAAAWQRVKQLVAEGKTLEQTLAAKPTAEWDEKWGAGFVNPQTFVTILYTDAAARAGGSHQQHRHD